MSVSYGGDKITFDDGTSLSTGYTHFRNRVINGDMRIDQRNAGVAQTWNNSNGYSLDRFFVYNSGGGGVFTTQRIADGPTGTAFANSMRVTITTADSSFGSGDVYFVQHKIEGFNVADLEWGTANAKTVTVSFWIKSSVTGSFPFTMIDNAGGNNYRSYGVLYTINAANTWEYKTITIPGETAGAAWGKSNDVGMLLSWGLGAGTNYVVSPNTWTTNKEAYKVSGDTNLISTLNATWQLTGVQLEVGSYATTFERRPYGTELQLCQRYFQIFGGTGTQHFAGGVMNTNRVNVILPFLTQMRASPSFSGTDFGSAWSNFTIYYGGGSITATGTNENYPSPTSISFGVTHAGSTTAGQAGYIYANSTNARLSFSAEL